MKVFVGCNNAWVSVPCDEKINSINDLAETAYDMLGCGKNKSNKLFLSSTTDGTYYDVKNRVSDVLTDFQFLKLDVIGSKNEKKTEKVFIHPSAALANSKETMIIDGESMTTEKLWQLSTGNYNIQISNGALKKIKRSRDILDEIVNENRVVYGVSTGFGKFANVVIPSDQLDQLQKNLIESHCAGVGDALTVERTRMLLALRINVLCKGYSGISVTNINRLVQAFNASCLPMIPEKGTVGASGDLAPLSHLAHGMMGNGMMWSPESGWADAKLVLEAHGVEPIVLGPKEGLAMINGTQFISSLGTEAVERARNIALQADVVAALTVEALSGTSRAFDAAIHKARPHCGQQEVAERMRTLLQYHGKRSQITDSHKNCNRVQDSYTLRCCPQVHGIAHDTIKFTKSTLDVELNSATDNPMVLCDREETISGGNFHGEYPAKVLDYLAIGIHEIAAMSERRIERLNNPALNTFPAFLVESGGLNSGYMIPHCTAAALVSENKCLCHPASVDSLSTSAGQEDHVSMGGYAARKAIKVVENVEYVIAIELLCACQAMEFHRPLTSTDALEAVYDVVRQVVPPYTKDRPHYKDMEAVTQLLRENKVWKAVKKHLENPPHPSDNVEQLSSSPTSAHIPEYGQR